jgi:hypothetical protein
MPIYRLLERSSFGPDEIKIIVSAYERACQEIKLTNRADLPTEQVAARVFRIAQTGERDPQIICERAVRHLVDGKR